jgi:hypothetical protein
MTSNSPAYFNWRRHSAPWKGKTKIDKREDTRKTKTRQNKDGTRSKIDKREDTRKTKTRQNKDGTRSRQEKVKEKTREESRQDKRQDKDKTR